MTTSDFTTTIQVDQTPEEVFKAINNVRGWWSEEIEGSTVKLNDEFRYHYQDVHRCKMKIVEFNPNEKVVWLVLDNYFKFTKDKSEWTGTKISFEISKQDNKTQLRFTHLGLVPQYECYEVCRDAWSNYIHNSLRSLISTGKGQPNATGKPRTENEEKLGSAVGTHGSN
jgi:Activator of Hsp90 ATPase homolog 1-like protein